MSERPRLLIEDWLPAAAIGVECMRERGSASALAPHTFLHVWWARRPLTASRAAVLASLLPADFPRDVFERLLGFGRPSADIVAIRRLMDMGVQVPGGYGYGRAFKHGLRESDIDEARNSVHGLWGDDIAVIDPMSGGGSIPFESARMGFTTFANEYNPVACTILEATVDYPFRHGVMVAQKAREWSKVWVERIKSRLARFYPAYRLAKVHAYIYARTVPCPDTGFITPLVPDWYLLHPKSGKCIIADPDVDQGKGTWRVTIKEIGMGAGQASEPHRPTYTDGKGISLFRAPGQQEPSQIPADYIKAMAQQGKMGHTLYAVALKSNELTFQPPLPEDLAALDAAAIELTRMRPQWERDGILPTERVPAGDKTGTDRDAKGTDLPLKRGEEHFADMFSARQLLAMGVLVEELRALRTEITAIEGESLGEAVVHLLAFGLDKFLNHNCTQTRWENTRAVVKGKMDRHDYAFKTTYAEMAPCNAGGGLEWALENVIESFEDICKLPKAPSAQPPTITQGSATSLPVIADGSMTAVVVDPPYDDNVQYSELADFFYVWLKRTQGHRRPEWFSTYLCDHDEEAVVNISRHRQGGTLKAADAKRESRKFYRQMMQDIFRECRRILRDDGVLTVMFTHKKQEAWSALFTSLIHAGFTITATWPVKTESEHSLHQAKKNAAQSTVILVARKRNIGTGIGYFNADMKTEIRDKARTTAIRLQREGLNAVDQLVGTFGPAMEVFSQYDEVRTDTGTEVDVAWAIDEAADAVSEWRIQQLAERGLDGVEPEGQFALLCWDVLGAAEFRFNEASLLGKAVGMDVEQLALAGLVEKKSENIRMLSAQERRRERPLEPDEIDQTLFGPVVVPKRRTKRQVLKIHPQDPKFRTALDACQALALRYIESGGDQAGIGSARGLMHQQRWIADSPVARLMEALVKAAPEALHHVDGARSAAAKYPEFRAWHTLLQPLFGIEPPDWTIKEPEQQELVFSSPGEEDEQAVFETDLADDDIEEGDDETEE